MSATKEHSMWVPMVCLTVIGASLALLGALTATALWGPK
jgi:hypothetical protein